MSFNPQIIEKDKDWIKIVSPSRKKRKYDSVKNSVELRNSFQVLQENDENQEEENDFSQSLPNATTGKVKIPPIVVYSHVQNHMKTLDLIKASMKADFDIKAKNNRIIVYTKNKEDYHTFIEKIKTSNVDYHTYTLPDKKVVKSILKGVPVNVTTKEIYDDLKVKNNLNVLDVKQLTRSVTTANNDQQMTRKLPVFLVTFKPTV